MGGTVYNKLAAEHTLEPRLPTVFTVAHFGENESELSAINVSAASWGATILKAHVRWLGRAPYFDKKLLAIF